MDNLINKQNISGINPAKQININETKPIVKEAIGNFFETFTTSNTSFSWKDDLQAQIAQVKNQTSDLKELLKTGASGSILNIVG